jgi:hypothetical protein
MVSVTRVGPAASPATATDEPWVQKSPNFAATATQ